MFLPFVTKRPDESDLQRLRLLISVFQDGSGEERDPWGRTRAGWKQLERIVAELIGGHSLEQKAVYDIIVTSEVDASIIGVSVKSKSLSQNKFEELKSTGRVHMELTNSLSKLWAPLKSRGIIEANFNPKAVGFAQMIGESLIDTVESWFINFIQPGQAVRVDIERSRFLVVSYTTANRSKETLYQVHSFGLRFPKNIRWVFHSEKCLRG